MLKAKLISIFSHDLSSPINNLKSLLELNNSNILNHEEVQSYFKEIKTSLDSIDSMKTDLLDWTHRQLDGFKSIKNPTKINHLIDELIVSVSMLARIKGIFIENTNQLTETLNLDSEVCKIILRNILTNAIKYSEADSRIVVDTKFYSNILSVTFQDFGIGMNQNQLDNLFTLKNKSRIGTYQEKGSGIGLAIAKDFADKIDAAIHVQSEVGKGSIFTVKFTV